MFRLTPTSSLRRASTLAEKIRLEGAGESSGAVAAVERNPANELDANGEPFREMFVMPKRKLRGQLQVEQMTGRSSRPVLSRMDIGDRLALRRPRNEEMATVQDWNAVWPAARTFNASVVPLPVRMGSRPHEDRRAPFKKQGNLELVKIPNFLHLTPATIEKHCNAMKQFCTEFPKELIDNEKLTASEFPMTVSYSDYVHQGTNIRDARSRVITMLVKVSALNLSKSEKEKLMRLAGKRYNEERDELTIITDRCHTRKQNQDYANYLLTVLYHEANKKEAWDELKERQDHLKVQFDGSPCKEQLVKLIAKSVQEDGLDSSLKSLGPDAKTEDIEKDKKVKEFGKMWENYRNTPETEDSTREYARRVRELLGIKSATESEVRK